jgi:HD-like signal output (HDOD) protein
MNFLRRLFGRPSEDSSAPPTELAPDEVIEEVAVEESVYDAVQDDWLAQWQEPEGLARSYFLWLSGSPGISSDEENAHCQAILAALERQLHFPASGAKLVPRVPTVLPQLLRSLRDDKVSGGALAQQLSKDAVLVAELIREANSPYYKASGKISSLDNAVMVLGQNGLRMLVARVAFRPVIGIQSGKFAKAAAPLIWEQAGLCANACAQLAGAAGQDPFTAYLAGLMQSVGLIVALRLVDQTSELEQMPCTLDFTKAFLAHAALLSAGIARQWDMPEAVAQAIEQQTRTHSEWGTLAQVLHTGSLLAQMQLLAKGGLWQADTADWPVALRDCYQALSEPAHDL